MHVFRIAFITIRTSTRGVREWRPMRLSNATGKITISSGDYYSSTRFPGFIGWLRRSESDQSKRLLATVITGTEERMTQQFVLSAFYSARGSRSTVSRISLQLACSSTARTEQVQKLRAGFRDGVKRTTQDRDVCCSETVLIRCTPLTLDLSPGP